MSRTKKNLQNEEPENNVTVVEDEDTTVSVATDVQKEKIRILISGIYDIQMLRIATGNKIVQSFNIQMGQKPSTKQADLEKETQKLLETLRNEYKKITDAYVNQYYESTTTSNDPRVKSETIKVTLSKNLSIDKVIKEMNKDTNAGITAIKSKLDYDLMKSYAGLCESEEVQLKVLDKEIKNHFLWDEFFKDIKGCGTLMAAVCIAYFDISKARHVSSFWRYAGLDTVPVTKDDGSVIREGRGKKHAKLTKVEYKDDDGNIKTRNSLGYNPIVKTKLVGVLADCMLKAGLRSKKDENGETILDDDNQKIKYALPDAKYVQIYLDYRSRLNGRTDTADYSDAHKHRMAARYMIKEFLRDLWVCWRKDAGYTVTEPYEVAKLGHKPHKYNEAQCEAAAGCKA